MPTPRRKGFIGLGAFLVPTFFPLGVKLLLPGGELNSFSYLTFSALILDSPSCPFAC
jgi:hypothetical protein